METQDLLANEVNIRRPELLEGMRINPIANGSEVVGESIDPDVDHLTRIERHRDPPGESAAADAEVAQTAAHKTQHFISA